MKPKRYLPNTSANLALVSLNDKRPFRAYWPMRLTQIVGGKRWSLSFTWFRTPTPIPVELAPLRDKLAEAIYAGGEKPDDWLTTVDRTPNQTSYDLADRILKGWAF